jgi:hypothetical protein
LNFHTKQSLHRFVCVSEITVPMSGGRSFVFQASEVSSIQAKSLLEMLHNSIRSIQTGNASKLRFEEIYRNAYTLVIHKYGDMLYEAVGQWIKDKLMETHKVVAMAQNDVVMDIIVQVKFYF